MRVQQQDWIGKWAIYQPQKVAVKSYETQEEFTYGQLNKMGNNLAHYLTNELALQKGDRIAILAENCWEYFVLFAVAQKMGVVLVPLNYRLTSSEIDYLLSDAQPAMLIVEEKFDTIAKQANTYTTIPHKISLSDLTTLGQSATVSFPLVELAEDDPIFLLYTSGTTGFPKGALYTHKMLFWNSINTAMSLVINTESRTVNCMPPFHTGGWNVLTTPFIHHGGYTCLMKKFDPSVALDLLAKEQVSIFMGVPTMLRMIADLPAFEQASFPSLYYIIVGGEPMPIPLIEQWHGKDVPIRQGFGMTEVGPNLTSLHQDDAIRKKGSIGRANFYVQIKIIDNTGKEVAPNQTGELLLKGPMVTPGYWGNQAATQQSIQSGWFHTGDIVRQDEEGYLYVVDRIKNMYISGGENVYPAEVERVLVAHPSITEAAVIGVADERWGETGKAFVVRHDNITKEEIIAYTKTHLAGFKVPRYIDFIAALPKNDTGKINRKALKKN